jgi:hypothetical protein
MSYRILSKVRPTRKLQSDSKPAFVQRPFSPSLGAEKPSWSTSSYVGAMRPPSSMSGEELGNACIAAAREKIESDKFWDMIGKRAIEIQTSLDPRDISLILNGMSRTRRLGDHLSVLEAFDTVIRKKLPYFSSTQIAMTTSAIAKSFPAACLPPELVPALLSEIKSRVHEFSTSVELSMILNALAKLGVVDLDLSKRFSSIIQSKIRSSTTSFHARELCVVASALSLMGVKDVGLYELIESNVLPVITELTPLEVSRLMLAFARGGKDIENLSTVTLTACGNRFRYMASSDLVSAVYGYGSVCEYVSIDSNSALKELLGALKLACIHSLPIFQPREIASVLLSFSRWRIDMSQSELETLSNRLRLMVRRLEGVDLVTIYGSLWVIAGDKPKTIESFLTACQDALIDSLSKVKDLSSSDWQSLARVVHAFTQQGKGALLIPSLSVCILNNSASLDRLVRTSLVQSLEEIMDPDSDLLLVLRENR